MQGWRAQLEQVETERDEAITAADETATAAGHTAEQAATVISDLQGQLGEQGRVSEGLRHEVAAAAAGRATAREDAAEAPRGSDGPAGRDQPVTYRTSSVSPLI